MRNHIDILSGGISPPQVFEVTRSIGKPTASIRRVGVNAA